MEEEIIRNKIRTTIMESEKGLRHIEALTGVSLSTLSRFLRGSTVSIPVFRKLENWCLGKPPNKAPLIAVKRFNVGNKSFLVSIVEVLKRR